MQLPAARCLAAGCALDCQGACFLAAAQLSRCGSLGDRWLAIMHSPPAAPVLPAPAAPPGGAPPPGCCGPPLVSAQPPAEASDDEGTILVQAKLRWRTYAAAAANNRSGTARAPQPTSKSRCLLDKVPSPSPASRVAACRRVPARLQGAACCCGGLSVLRLPPIKEHALLTAQVRRGRL